ncbi:MAG: hypothetical protein A2084_01645 [Tenericutes bacterium GWC2_39_45]|nr:MAG: hypothetical protein A2Y43_03900 [Tenericutes bacterium GWA2_38_26]OHE31199.1 MAG: hypothetical protein A2084_01645 [Tenericutes bacterium GWC2_39_45]OHE31669.1 MAG: hypothetical protein A2009_01740 [Tenericutes bacterium GWD2_38_27]
MINLNRDENPFEKMMRKQREKYDSINQRNHMKKTELASIEKNINDGKQREEQKKHNAWVKLFLVINTLISVTALILAITSHSNT